MGGGTGSFWPVFDIALFPYSTSPTPTDAIEIAWLSEMGLDEAYILMRFIRDWMLGSHSRKPVAGCRFPGRYYNIFNGPGR